MPSLTDSSQRWKKAHRQTKVVLHLSREMKEILLQLARANCLGTNDSAASSKSQASKSGANRHSSYLTKLRSGMKKRIMQHHHFVAGTAARAAADMASGAAITEVECEEQIAELEYWRQGDASLATEEKLREREVLRFDRRVVNELNTIWQVVVCSACRPADGTSVDATEHEVLSKEGHAMMMRRIYRIMLKTYDEADATETIAKDWESDAKGKPSLSRKDLGDSLFELADTWTAGICACEYVLFLRKLCGQISDLAAFLPAASWPDGSPVMETVLKDPESSCVFDAETYGEDDDESEEDEEDSGNGKGKDDGNGSGKAGKLGTVQHWALRKDDLRRKKVEDAGPQMLGLSSFGSKLSSGRINYRSKAKMCVKQGFEPPASVRRIQGTYRSKVARKTVAKRKQAVLTVQSGVRGKLAKKEVQKRRKAIVTIQSRIRGRLARKKMKEMADVKQGLKHALRKAPLKVERQAKRNVTCYWCQVKMDNDAGPASGHLPETQYSTAPSRAPPPLVFAARAVPAGLYRDAPTLSRSGSQPTIGRPSSAGLLRSVVCVPPAPSLPASRPSSAASRATSATRVRIPRVPSADVLRNQRGSWTLQQASSLAVWRKAGQGLTPEGANHQKYGGPDRYMWYRASGAMDVRRSANVLWDPIVGRLI